MRRPAVVGAVALVLAVGALGATAVLKQGVATDDRQRFCERIRGELATLGDSPVGEGAWRVAVLGDSYAQGWKLDQPLDAWPRAMGEELGAAVIVDGFAGSGFTTSGGCGQVAYADRVDELLESKPDLVVVEGGLNDTWASAADVRANARTVLHALASVDVVVVGPPLAPARDDARVLSVDAALADTSHGTGVQYVSTVPWTLEYLPDELHLTVEGHHDFGDRVAAEIMSHPGFRPPPAG